MYKLLLLLMLLAVIIIIAILIIVILEKHSNEIISAIISVGTSLNALIIAMWKGRKDE